MNITVFDEHHEALLFWEESLLGGALKKSSTLVHVDGHDDLGCPSVLGETVYSPNIHFLVENEINIGNFIIPAILRGIFKKVIFLGRREHTDKVKRNLVGTLLGQGKWINNGFRLTGLTRRLYPDWKKWYYLAVVDPALIGVKGAVALDIDLDYFCGHYFPSSPPPPLIGLTDSQIRKFNKASKSNDKYGISLSPQIRYKDRKYVYPKHIHNQIIYNDSKKWIEYAISLFVNSIKFRPDVVSICRSVKSGFTPAKYAQFIEGMLLKYLKGEQTKMLDPCDITEPFKIHPFILRLRDRLYNPLTREFIMLNKDHAFVWGRICKKNNFAQILDAMMCLYDVAPDTLKQGLVKFIFKLKYNWVIS